MTLAPRLGEGEGPFPDTVAVETATRTVQWNVTSGMVWLMYLSLAGALLVFAYGAWRRIRVWRLGRPAARWDRPWYRLRRLLVLVFGHVGLLKSRVAGAMHALIFFGFLALFAATVVVFIHHEMGFPIMEGRFYLYFQSLAVNILGALAMVGVGIAMARRYIRRVPHLERREPADGLLLIAIFLILVTGYVISGARIIATDDPWGWWRPVSYLTGLGLEAFVLEQEGLEAVHRVTWVGHVVFWHGLLAITPFTKLFHVVSSSLSLYFTNLGPRGMVPALDFEDPEQEGSLGIGSPRDMTWKQLLDLDACTECGRCEAVCPAWAESKPLSPKRVILDLRDHVRAHAPALLAAGDEAAAGATEGHGGSSGGPVLAGEVIRAETLWACTTCRACEEECPVGIEHVPLIVQLRQHLAMEQAEAPEGITEVASSLEARGHPFRGASAGRTEWMEAPSATNDREDQ